MAKRIFYDHFFDEGLKKWVLKMAHQHVWRMPSDMDFDDLVQEGFLCYAICRQRYKVENKSHMMSLVKITFINQITDLANKRTRQPDVLMSDIIEPGTESEFLEEYCGAQESDAELIYLLNYAPAEVSAILEALNSDSVLARLRRPFRVRGDGSRETMNERLCRLANVPLFDFESALRALLA